MNENDGFNLRNYGLPYNDQWEMTDDFCLILDVWLYYHYTHHQWVGPENRMQNMLGLAVSRAEFELNLQKAARSTAGANLTPEECADIQMLRDYFFSRMRALLDSPADMPFATLIRRFGLDEFSIYCLLLAFVSSHERKYEKIFVYLQDDITQKHPLADTAIDILASPGERLTAYYQYFLPESVLRRFLLAETGAEDGLRTPLVIHPRILDFLLNNGYAVPPWLRRQQDIDLHEVKVRDGLTEHISGAIRSGYKTALIYVTGTTGSGRSFHIAHALEHLGKKALYVDTKAVMALEGGMEMKTRGLIREAVLYGGHLCFCGFEVLPGDTKELSGFISALSQSENLLGGAVFVTSEKQWNECNLPPAFIKIDIDVPGISQNQQLVLWNYFIEGKVPSDCKINLSELTSKFNFTPLQIKNSIRKADGLRAAYGKPVVDIDMLTTSCYEQVTVNLGSLATHIKPVFKWDDIVLPQNQKNLLNEACMYVQYKHKVYHEWGYDGKLAYGKGLSMLFSGPPGTGKTMAAQIVAGRLRMELYKIQLSAVVSKYIGETEKNLRNVFMEATNSGCILFFDETDALFGKRSEVKDSHDRHANVETAFLLQQMEEYEGVIIMCTNLFQNIDGAFIRRINFVIHFPFPETPVRETLWRKMLASSAPLDNGIDYGFLAERFVIAGGEIKNIVLHAAFLAAAQNEAISMRHLLRGAVVELRKSNAIVSKEDLREYSDIIFE